MYFMVFNFLIQTDIITINSDIDKSTRIIPFDNVMVNNLKTNMNIIK